MLPRNVCFSEDSAAVVVDRTRRGEDVAGPAASLSEGGLLPYTEMPTKAPASFRNLGSTRGTMAFCGRGTTRLVLNGSTSPSN